MKTAICCGYICCDVVVTADSFPEENHKHLAQEFDMSAGGPATNAACLLSRWGVQTILLGQIGSDRFGGAVLDELRNFGVNCDYLQQYDGPTDCSVVISNRENGTRTVLSKKFSDGNPRDMTMPNLRPDGVLVDGHQFEWSCQLLQSFDGVSVLDAGSFRPQTEYLLSKVTDPVASAVFFKEFSKIHGAKPQSLAKFHIDQLVVTDGERPVAVISPSGRQLHSVFNVTPVDTLGAGDIFHGAYLFGKMYGFSIEQTIVLASAAAAVSVTRLGGCRSIPSLPETVQFLASNSCASHDQMIGRLAELVRKEFI